MEEWRSGITDENNALADTLLDTNVRSLTDTYTNTLTDMLPEMCTSTLADILTCMLVDMYTQAQNTHVHTCKYTGARGIIAKSRRPVNKTTSENNYPAYIPSSAAQHRQGKITCKPGHNDFRVTSIIPENKNRTTKRCTQTPHTHGSQLATVSPPRRMMHAR